MRHYQSLLQSPHFYRWVNWGREKGTLSSRRERRRFRAWYPLQLLLSCLASASLLQGGFALLELRSIMGDLALDSWSLVELPSFQNCFPVERPWEMANRPSHRPHFGESTHAVPVTRQMEWLRETGGSYGWGHRKSHTDTSWWRREKESERSPNWASYTFSEILHKQNGEVRLAQEQNRRW